MQVTIPDNTSHSMDPQKDFALIEFKRKLKDIRVNEGGYHRARVSF